MPAPSASFALRERVDELAGARRDTTRDGASRTGDPRAPARPGPSRRRAACCPPSSPRSPPSRARGRAGSTSRGCPRRGRRRRRRERRSGRRHERGTQQRSREPHREDPGEPLWRAPRSVPSSSPRHPRAARKASERSSTIRRRSYAQRSAARGQAPAAGGSTGQRRWPAGPRNAASVGRSAHHADLRDARDRARAGGARPARFATGHGPCSNLRDACESAHGRASLALRREAPAPWRPPAPTRTRATDRPRRFAAARSTTARRDDHDDADAGGGPARRRRPPRRSPISTRRSPAPVTARRARRAMRPVARRGQVLRRRRTRRAATRSSWPTATRTSRSRTRFATKGRALRRPALTAAQKTLTKTWIAAEAGGGRRRRPRPAADAATTTGRRGRRRLTIASSSALSSLSRSRGKRSRVATGSMPTRIESKSGTDVFTPSAPVRHELGEAIRAESRRTRDRRGRARTTRSRSDTRGAPSASRPARGPARPRERRGRGGRPGCSARDAGLRGPRRRSAPMRVTMTSGTPSAVERRERGLRALRHRLALLVGERALGRELRDDRHRALGRRAERDGAVVSSSSGAAAAGVFFLAAAARLLLRCGGGLLLRARRRPSSSARQRPSSWRAAAFFFGAAAFFLARRPSSTCRLLRLGCAFVRGRLLRAVVFFTLALFVRRHSRACRLYGPRVGDRLGRRPCPSRPRGGPASITPSTATARPRPRRGPRPGARSVVAVLVRRPGARWRSDPHAAAPRPRRRQSRHRPERQATPPLDDGHDGRRRRRRPRSRRASTPRSSSASRWAA